MKVSDLLSTKNGISPAIFGVMKLQKLPPKKTDMKPEHQTFEKENHLNQISIMTLRSMLVFGGCINDHPL